MTSKLRKLFVLMLVAGCVAGGATAVQAADVLVTANIAASETWTSDNTYILTEVIYVTAGATLTIEAGTVVRGEGESSPGANDPGTLAITRGSKIRVLGTEAEPVVFTDLFDDNVGGNPGSFPYDSVENALSLTGQWGGLILLGRGYVANNTLAGASQAREVQIEGLTPEGGLGFYGNCAADPVLSAADACDDDDSGEIHYLSIRYGGFNLSPNNEINGLTLGAVGRTTAIDHVEVFQNKDDGIEFFGGSAQVKNAIVANVGDDGVDYDEGWRGKMQYVLVLQGIPGSDKSDKGGEHDGGNGPDGSQPLAIPTIYNATYIGHGAQKAYTDASRNTALHFRDNAGGRYYNSFFADFGGATMVIEGGSTTGTDPNTSGERTQTAYTIDGQFYLAPDSEFQWEMRDNCFFCFGNGERGEPLVPTGDATAWGGDAGKVHHDPGVFTTDAWDNDYLDCWQKLPIRALTRTALPFADSPDPVTEFDPRATPGLGLTYTERQAPDDGFFALAPFKGAFDKDSNWAYGWSTLSRLGYFPDPAPGQVPVTENITVSQTWTADNEYILGNPIYVTNGATLTIQAGTVIRGEGESSPGANDPGTLIVARGSKLQALGTKAQPIVFTDLNDSNVGNGTPSAPYDSLENALGITGQWGGVILLGRGYVANNTLAGASQAREVQIEGLTPEGGLGFYGNCAADPDLSATNSCDDDDSGQMRYVSIRYGGFNLSPNNEINGLTLGAVGRETDLHHIEVFQNKDDGIEFFGGTANVKHVAIANVGDDGIDYDEGWRGKVQFGYVQQGLPGADKSDKGGEWDGGNGPDGSQPLAIPTLYNVTMIGHGAEKAYTDASRNTALHMRDNAGGRTYNSFFADFGGATLLIEGGSTTGTDPNTSGERSQTAYVIDGNFYREPASQFQLENRDNSYFCFGNAERAQPLVPTGDATAWGGDAGKVHHDPGVFTTGSWNNQYIDCADPLPIRELTRTVIPDPGTPDVITKVDPRPADGSPLLSTDRTPPADGFFTPADYRGAFDGQNNWLSGWSTLFRLGYFDKPQVLVSADISASQTWSADNEYVLTQPIYVSRGATLTIEPGTVVRGEGESSPGANDPGALIIARGSKIVANGTPSNPIVFTDLFDDNLGMSPGTAPYDRLDTALGLTGQWGGVILLGRGYVANNTLAGASQAREVQIEGLTPEGGLGFYGNCAADSGLSASNTCDDDDSGSLSYVSIRYGGFNLSPNNEINGLTLGAVGRATDLHHIEVFQNKDDGIEFFGGTASVKHVAIVNVGDDGIDYDEGWRGKVQFGYVQQGLPGADKSDKGGEWDGGNGPDGSQPLAIPTLYNVTMIGHGAEKAYTDASRNTALHIRDNAGGRTYNSFFADFGGATVLVEGGSTTGTDPNTSGERSQTAYVIDGNFYLEPASQFQLENRDNAYWCFGNAERAQPLVPTGDATAWGGDAGKVHHDPGVFTNGTWSNGYYPCDTAVPLRNLVRTAVPVAEIPDIVTSVDPRPDSSSYLAVPGRAVPADGFFSAAPYKGAFSPTHNWLAGWSTLDRLGYFPECGGSSPLSIPNEVGYLTVDGAGKDEVSWVDPLGTNAWVVTKYDVLKATLAFDFDGAACLATNTTDTVVTDAAVPGPGAVFYYLVRPENACGLGSLGSDSNGVERTGIDCE